MRTVSFITAVLLCAAACEVPDPNVPDRFSYEKHIARRPGNSTEVWVVRDHQTEQCYLTLDLSDSVVPTECTSEVYLRPVQPPAEAE